MPALAVAKSAKIICVSPPMTPVTAGAPPRNGMLVMSTPAMALNNSSDSRVAVPPEAWLSLPGLALASATSSCTDFAGTPSCDDAHGAVGVGLGTDGCGHTERRQNHRQQDGRDQAPLDHGLPP
jgi:hypothetical protein